MEGCSDGVIGLLVGLEEGTLEGPSVGFTEGLFGAILDSGRAVVGLTVSFVGLFCCTGAKTEGILGVITDGTIGAFTDGKFGYISRGF
jgi:hypothetical protein